MRDSSSRTVDVLIVGAGPAGLMMACQLAYYGIPFRIIEKQNRMISYSGAMFIQARTLEMFDAMGVAESVIEQGRVVEYISLFQYGKRVLRIPVSKMGEGLSKFPFLFMLPQYQTENILLDFLNSYNCVVDYNTQLVSLRRNKHEVNATVASEGSETTCIQCRYLIGADGINSTVRQQLNIPWQGEVNDIPLFVTDCYVQQQELQNNNIATFEKAGSEVVFAISNKSIAGLFPIHGNLWRIDSVVPEEFTKREDVTFREVAFGFRERMQLNAKLSNSKWFSVFRSNTFLADTFQKENCFLIGDAAHVHTPIGAQGMNTGLQDACNLGWKLAFAIQGKVNSEILTSYTQERRPVAKKLIQSTDRYFDLTISKKLVPRVFRQQIFPFLVNLLASWIKSESWQRAFFKKISEIGISYNSRSIIRYSKGPLEQGNRLPFIKWNDESGNTVHLHQKASRKSFTLICFIREHHITENLHTALNELEIRFTDLLTTEVILHTVSTRFLFTKLKIKNNTFCLIRPDGYIAITCATKHLKTLRTYLGSLIHETPF